MASTAETAAVLPYGTFTIPGDWSFVPSVAVSDPIFEVTMDKFATGPMSFDASNCVDGDDDTWCRTASGDSSPWLQLDFGSAVPIAAVVLANPGVDPLGSALNGTNVSVTDGTLADATWSGEFSLGPQYWDTTYPAADLKSIYHIPNATTDNLANEYGVSLPPFGVAPRVEPQASAVDDSFVVRVVLEPKNASRDESSRVRRMLSKAEVEEQYDWASPCAQDFFRRISKPGMIRVVLAGQEILHSAGRPTMTPYGEVSALERPSWRDVEPGDNASHIVIRWTGGVPANICKKFFEVELIHDQVHDFVVDPKRSGCALDDLIFIQTSCNEHPLIGEGAFDVDTTSTASDFEHEHDDWLIWLIIIIIILLVVIVCVVFGYLCTTGSAMDGLVVVIKTVEGELLNLKVKPSDSIAQVKLQVQNEHGTPKELQQLSYAGDVLKSTWTISEYNIPTEAVIHLHVLDTPDAEETFGDIVTDHTAQSTAPHGNAATTPSVVNPLYSEPDAMNGADDSNAEAGGYLDVDPAVVDNEQPAEEDLEGFGAADLTDDSDDEMQK